jgi:nucleoprotein TPR
VIQTALQEERDKLLAEKASWANKVPEGATAVPEDTTRTWEAEKGELVKARDDALAEVKVGDSYQQAPSPHGTCFRLRRKNIRKPLRRPKNSSGQLYAVFSNSSCTRIDIVVQDKYQARINTMMKAKAAEDERLAVEKSNNEQGSIASAAQTELVKRHAEELRSLEAKLTANHQEELKAAVEKAQQEKPAPNAGGDQNTQTDQKAAVDAAIAELQAKHAEEISAAVERGRMESAAKGKLKDSQLVRAQKRVKDLEAQILSLPGSAAGPSASPVAGPSTGPSVSTSAIASNPAQAATSPITQNPTPTPVASATPLPRKPSVANNAPPTGPARGAGRGAVRGRGVQRVLGGAVGLGRAAPAKPAEAPPAGGMQIMGAAMKRPLDDTSSEDSLAKRLKPAEPVPKPPVQIRRPPSGAPPPQ